jgi:hypothetical protein
MHRHLFASINSQRAQGLGPERPTPPPRSVRLLPYLTLPALRESIVPADWTLAPSTPPDGDGTRWPPPNPKARLTEDLADRIRNARPQ